MEVAQRSVEKEKLDHFSESVFRFHKSRFNIHLGLSSVSVIGNNEILNLGKYDITGGPW